MKKFDDKPFEDFTSNARLQILFLEWTIIHFNSRRQTGNAAIDQIEADFDKHIKSRGQTADKKFRFDDGDFLLILAQPILTASVESIVRHSQSKDIISGICSDIGDYDSFVKQFDVVVNKLEPIPKENSCTTWTFLKRIRNSIAHFRHEYSPDGNVTFKDYASGKETANFSMSGGQVLRLAYGVGLACLKVQEELLAPLQKK